MSRESIRTLRSNSIKYMVKHVEEFELVRSKKHPEYRFARDYFKSKGICYQNFYKFYSRYISSGRDVSKLLPQKRGPRGRYRNSPFVNESEVDSLIIGYRKKGLNKFEIAALLKRKHNIKRSASPSSVYRALKAHGMSRLNKTMKEEKRKIVKKRAGELVHVDCHYLPKGIVKTEPTKRYYVLGAIDDYSRVVWVEVMKSVKSIDATFAMMDAMLTMKQRYDVEAEAVMTDNGSEFCSPNIEQHPFERLLIHFDIKHRRTKPYRPQTNGKIERFWRTFDEDVIEGVEFENLEELREAVLGYNLFYNEMRPHQGIQGKTPIEKLGLTRKE